MEYEIVWCGAHKDRYLCIPEPEVRDLSHVKPAGHTVNPWKYESREPLRQRVLAVIATRKTWFSGALRLRMGIDRATFFNLIRDLETKGFVTHPSRGVVALRAGERRGSEAKQ